MKKERISMNAIGGCSLLTVFAVLCLTVLALLNYSSALAEKRLSDAAAQAVKEYYFADLEAEIVRSRLNNGETVSGIEITNNSVMYTVSFSGDQFLEAEMVKTGEKWQVKRWQTMAKQQKITEELPVFTGE